MRIAIIAPPWVPVPPPAYGGVEAVLDGLARGVRDAGHDVLLFATGDSTCPVPTRWILDTAAGTTQPGSATELHHVVNAYDEVLTWGADVVHDHTLVGPLYGQTLGAPVVTTNHGPFDAVFGDYYRAIGAAVPIVAISHHQASTALNTPVAAVIHHAVDVDAFPLGPGAGGYAVFLGRMSRDKGVHTAVTVARAASIPLRIAAKMREPAEFAYFEETVAPLLDDDAVYVGEVGGDTKLELLGDAVCLLNPLAWDEPFGMVMIEAMACGTPVVATPFGSVPELITRGVTGFVERTGSELGRAIRRAGQLDRAVCRAEAAARFSLERLVDDHLTLYERIKALRRRAA